MSELTKRVKEVSKKHFPEWKLVVLGENSLVHSSQYALCDRKFGAKIIFDISKDYNVFHTYDMDGIMSNHYVVESWIKFLNEVEGR